MPCRGDQRRHLGDGRFHAVEDRPADDAVPDVEFLDLGDRRHRLHVQVSESVPGVDGEAERPGRCRRAPQGVQRPPIAAPVVGVVSGVQLDRGDAEVEGGTDRALVGVDEEADPNAGILEPANRLGDAGAGAGEVESAFRRNLLAPLRNDGGLEGSEIAGECHDVGTGGQFQVQDGGDRCCQPTDVVILNVPAILAQVRRDPVRSSALGRERRHDRIGLVRAPRLPYRGYVIDVDVEAHENVAVGGGIRLVSLFNDSIVRHLLARMHKVVLALATACVAMLPNRLVAQAEPTPEAAVNAFMKAVTDSNLARMTQLWGTSDGSAATTRKPADFQKRIYVTYAFLKGGTYKISATEPNPKEANERYMILEFNRGDCNKLVPITAVKTKKEGWIVNSLDLSQVGVPGRSCTGVQTPKDTGLVTVVDTVKPAPGK